MAEARWLEVSLVVDGELAEAVADVLGRFVSNGVVMESGVIYDERDEVLGHAGGPVRIFGYLPVDAHLEERRQRLEEGLWHLGQIQELPAPAYRTIADEDWMAAWKQHYQPIRVGKRQLVLPAWMDVAEDGRVAIKIDPSMAFGTGTHPTTQLCMALIEDLVRLGEPVIDVGCGSGILSIAALKLGAGHALAVDVDSQAVRATRENAQANDVLERVETGEGSVLDVLTWKFSLASAPLVLANILAPIIKDLFKVGLADLVDPGGSLILSGILAHQADDVVSVAEANGLRLSDRRQMEDWVGLVVTRPA